MNGNPGEEACMNLRCSCLKIEYHVDIKICNRELL
jgi:hypothetical protein